MNNFGRCDVCFNNSGLVEAATVEAIDIERVCTMARVNVEGAFRMAYTFLKHFVQQGQRASLQHLQHPGQQGAADGGRLCGDEVCGRGILRCSPAGTGQQAGCAYLMHRAGDGADRFAGALGGSAGGAVG